MVLKNTNKNNFIILEGFASVYTVSSYFPKNRRTHSVLNIAHFL